jgi:hypothetical protein
MGFFSKIGSTLDTTIDKTTNALTDGIEQIKEHLEDKYKLTDMNIVDPDETNTFTGTLDEIFEVLNKKHNIKIEKIND